MEFAIGLVFGAVMGAVLASLLAANKIGQIDVIVDRLDSYKESVDKAVGLVYEVAEKNKKLEQEKRGKEFMEKMLKGEPGPDDWRSL